MNWTKGFLNLAKGFSEKVPQSRNKPLHENVTVLVCSRSYRLWGWFGFLLQSFSCLGRSRLSLVDPLCTKTASHIISNKLIIN